MKKGLIRKILAVILIIALVTGLENYAGIVDTKLRQQTLLRQALMVFQQVIKHI